MVTDRFTVDALLAGDGAAVIVHAEGDNHAHIPERYQSADAGEPGPDEATRATGDAGERFACGVVEAGDAPTVDAPTSGDVAQARLEGPAGVSGTVVFAERADGRTQVRVDLEGLPGGGFHGFHLHERGRCRPDFGEAGDHLDPHGRPHGQHAGDLPALLATAEGQASAWFITDRVDVASLLEGGGAAAIVHAEPDNYAHVPDRYQSAESAQPGPDEATRATGDAGERLACGAIAPAAAELPDAPAPVPFAWAPIEAPVDFPDSFAGDAYFSALDDGRVALYAQTGKNFDTPLPKAGFHGFHLHATGSCEDDYDAAGGHFALGGRSHGEHVGDLPPLLADDRGSAWTHVVTDRFTVDELLAGDDTAVIVHAEADNHAHLPNRYQSADAGEPGPDEATRATGDVGERLRCGEVVRTLTLERLGGPDRVETALKIWRRGPSSAAADAVVLARADDFADALAGAPLAADRRAPTLLTGGDELDPRTREAINEALHGPAARDDEPAATDGRGRVYVLGGPAAISDDVVDTLRADGHEVDRLAGADRFATSAAIAEALEETPFARPALLASGDDFPDAVTAGAAAAHTGGAVLLTPEDGPHPAVTDYLAAREPTETYAIGGPAAAVHPEATDVAGAHRWATAVEVAETFFDEPPTVGLARSDAFPDALTGGAPIGDAGGPVLLTQPDELHPDTEAYVCDNATRMAGRAYVFGGTGAISVEVEETARERLSRRRC